MHVPPQPNRWTLNQRCEQELRLLDRLDATGRVTQRALASELGIALGLTNFLIRQLVKKGWVRVTRLSPKRIRYLLTPTGVAARARLTRDYLLSSVEFYRTCRQHFEQQLLLVAAHIEANRDPCAGQGVVFFGTGDAADIAYLCLQRAGLKLLGVVAESGPPTFFDHPVFPPTDLSAATLAGRDFSMLVVMPSERPARVRQLLQSRDVPAQRVFWL